MTKKTYPEKLRDPRWQKKRLEILKRDKFACVLCKDKESELQIHHLKYGKEPWLVDNSYLKTLCHHCHWLVESAKKRLPFENIKGILKSKKMPNSALDFRIFIVNHTGGTIMLSKDGEKVKVIFLAIEHMPKIIKFMKS